MSRQLDASEEVSDARRVRLALNPQDEMEDRVVDKLTSMLGDEMLVTLYTMLDREMRRPIAMVITRGDDYEAREGQDLLPDLDNA